MHGWDAGMHSWRYKRYKHERGVHLPFMFGGAWLGRRSAIMQSTGNPKGYDMARNTVKQDADWITVDPNTLDAADLARFTEYKEAYKMMKAAREAFENGMQASVPEGERMIFGYNFGKLSVAIVADDRKPAKAKATVSLADYLAARAASGLAN